MITAAQISWKKNLHAEPPTHQPISKDAKYLKEGQSDPDCCTSSAELMILQGLLVPHIIDTPLGLKQNHGILCGDLIMPEADTCHFWSAKWVSVGR